VFYLLSTLWILSITALLVILTKKRFEVVLPFSFICGTLVLYIFGFINKISWGYCLTWVIAIGTIVYIIYKTIKDRSFIKDLKERYITIGLFVFIILLVYVFVLFKYQGFTYCDEFMHWGPMVKETIRLDGFYTQTSSLLEVHKDYPPFFSLLETLFCFLGGGYNESYLYVGLITFMFSMFMLLFRKLKVKNKIDYLKALLMLVGIVLIGVTISRTETAGHYITVYNSIYIDWALALITSFTLYLIFIEKEWNFMNTMMISLCFVSLVLSKQMGLPFYLLTLLFLIIKFIFVDKKRINIRYLLLFIVIPIVVYSSWSFVKGYYQVSSQFNVSNIYIGDFINYLKGTTSQDLMYKHDVIFDFLRALKNRPLITNPINLSYFVVVLIQIVLILIIQRKDGILISIIYAFGSIAYAVTMLILYTFLFTVDEATILASFDRYMMSYLYIGNTLILMLAYEKIDVWWKYVISLVIIFLFVEKKDLSLLVPKISIKENYDLKILMVEQFKTGTQIENRDQYNGTKYQIDKITGIVAGETEEQFNKNKKELLNKIKEYDYLFVFAYDDHFYKLFKEISGIEDLHNNTLYQIVKNDDGTFKFENAKSSNVDFILHYYIFGTVDERFSWVLE